MEMVTVYLDIIARESIANYCIQANSVLDEIAEIAS